MEVGQGKHEGMDGPPLNRTAKFPGLSTLAAAWLAAPEGVDRGRSLSPGVGLISHHTVASGWSLQHGPLLFPSVPGLGGRGAPAALPLWV